MFSAIVLPDSKVALSMTDGPSVDSSSTIIPLSLCGGAYCIQYTIDSQPFRAVIDTGSPFVLVDGTCAAEDIATSRSAALATTWGCYRGSGKPSGLDDTDELYGGEDVGVEWRRGRVGFPQLSGGSPLMVNDAVFGVVRSYIGKGGGGAVFLGLAKRRLPRIRPTLLEQTEIAALRFDFRGRRMELSPSSLIPKGAPDALKMLDLRIAGAPVANYAVRVKRLLVNGEPISLDRPLVAVIDTGTTGVSVSDSLFDSDRLPPQWRDARIELPTESGRGVCALEASVRKRRPSSPGIPTLNLPLDTPEYSEFPLVVSPIHVPWFDPGFGQEECADGQPFQCNGKPLGQRRSLTEELRFRGLGIGSAPHVIFVGLAFLWQRELTIDVDDGRMLIM